jgi:rubrerythrin
MNGSREGSDTDHVSAAASAAPAEARSEAAAEDQAREAASMTAQLELLERPPRRKPRKLMHVFDYGSGMAHFKCEHCGYDDDWTPAAQTVSEDRRGRPCPVCSPIDSRTHDAMPGRASE